MWCRILTYLQLIVHHFYFYFLFFYHTSVSHYHQACHTIDLFCIWAETAVQCACWFKGQAPFWAAAVSSVVLFSKHITYVAIGSLRGICVLRSGQQSAWDTAGPEGARHNTGRWPLGASGQVHHNQPLVSFQSHLHAFSWTVISSWVGRPIQAEMR